MAIEMAEDESFPLSREEAVRRVAGLLVDPPSVFVRAPGAADAIATGLPASPGVASGPIATSSEAAESVANNGRAPILVRPETSPEDVRGMSRSAGVLTASGGLASHAAVVARGWGIPAVVGARAVSVDGDDVRIGDRSMRAGELISIDGSTGEIFAGELAGTHEVAPEAATLLAWASELAYRDRRRCAGGRLPRQSSATTPADAAAATVDDVLVALAIKGASPLRALVEAIGAEVAEVEALLAQLYESAFVETADDQVRLTGAGKLAAGDAIAAERAAAEVDDDGATQLLDEFHPLDGRMKEIVTAWQVRDVAGEQILNDHSDASYDASLLDDLAALDADTAAWLDPLARPLRQFRVYRARLSRALESARGGDQRFVASPRVDSYHSVWFELHEHLIRLTGRKRTGTE